MKQTMTNLKGEIKISTIIFGDFKTLSIMVEHIERRSIRTESSWKTLSHNLRYIKYSQPNTLSIQVNMNVLQVRPCEMIIDNKIKRFTSYKAYGNK